MLPSAGGSVNCAGRRKGASVGSHPVRGSGHFSALSHSLRRLGGRSTTRPRDKRRWQPHTRALAFLLALAVVALNSPQLTASADAQGAHRAVDAAGAVGRRWEPGPPIGSVRTPWSRARQSTAVSTTKFPWPHTAPAAVKPKQLRAPAAKQALAPVPKAGTYATTVLPTPGETWPTSGPPSANWYCTPAYISPAWNATLETTTPTLEAQVQNGDTPWTDVQIRVTDNPDSPTWSYAGTAGSGGASLTMPLGVLQDGGTYYWVAHYANSDGSSSGPECGPGGWGPWYQFHVDLHVQRGNDPTDSLAGTTVDLASGGLSYNEQTPSFPTPGGPVGFNFTYNSRAQGNFGLGTSVWDNPNDEYTGYFPQVVGADMTELYSTTEPGLVYPQYLADQAGQGGSGWYVVSYSGLLSLPAGTWSLQLSTNSGGGTWCGQSSCNSFSPETTLWLGTSSSPTGQVSGNQATTTVTYVSSGQAVYFQLQAVAGTGSPSAAAGTGAPLLEAGPSGGSLAALPASWFASSEAVLPDGWSESSDGLLTTDYNYLRPGTNEVQVIDSAGQAHTWSWTGAGWAPPEGDQGSLLENPNGTWALTADDGDIYQFSANGQLTSMAQPTDDQKPGSPTFAYSAPVAGLPPRLTSVVDAAGRGLSLVYGGNGDCPTAAGFDADAPADMLCQVNYDPSPLPAGATSGFEAGSTDLYYSGGHLARVTEPGDATVGYPTTDFGYTNYSLDGVSEALLSSVRSPLVNDAIAAGTISEPPSAPGEPANAHQTVISYETPADGSYALGQVASVTAPTAADTAGAWGAREEHSYSYSPAGPAPSTTTVVVAGETTSSGFARQVSFDPGGFMSQDVGADGVAVDYTWDDATQQVLTEIDHHAPTSAGLETTWAYDPEGRQADKWARPRRRASAGWPATTPTPTTNPTAPAPRRRRLTRIRATTKASTGWPPPGTPTPPRLRGRWPCTA